MLLQILAETGQNNFFCSLKWSCTCYWEQAQINSVWRAQCSQGWDDHAAHRNGV